MKKIFVGSVMLIFLMAMIGCWANPDIHIALIDPENGRSDGSPVNRENIDKLVKRFIRALNDEDAHGVLACLDEEMIGYFTVETVETAIEDYNAYFDGKMITNFKFAGKHPQNDNHLLYIIESLDGETKAIQLIIKDDGVYVFDEFLGYSYKAKHMLKKFTYALAQRDPKGIARLLSKDDKEYPKDKAMEVIKNYKKAFDLSFDSLGFELEDINPQESSLIYRITGEKDGKPAAHPVSIIYGDDGVKLEDEWVP